MLGKVFVGVLRWILMAPCSYFTLTMFGREIKRCFGVSLLVVSGMAGEARGQPELVQSDTWSTLLRGVLRHGCRVMDMCPTKSVKVAPGLGGRSGLWDGSVG